MSNVHPLTFSRKDANDSPTDIELAIPTAVTSAGAVPTLWGIPLKYLS